MAKLYPVIYSIALLFFPGLSSFTQEMPVKEIPEVVVETNKQFFSEDHTIRSFETSADIGKQHDNIGYILERKSAVLIRNYGAAGSLTSISMHGTGSNHTQVTWNGIPLNSPSTGQADLSLIPSGFINSVEVINGASGSLFGSGTFGGSVNLNNEPDWNNRISFSYSLNTGSYGSMGNMLTVKAGGPKIQYQLSAIVMRAENDYTYRDQYFYKSPQVRNTHNAYRSYGILQNVYLNLNKGSYLEGGLWYQHKTLEIPALMGSYKVSHAEQKDSLFRSFISYKKSGKHYSLGIKSAWFSDFLQYTDKNNIADSVYSLNSRIANNRFMNEADFRLFMTSRLIAGGGFSFNRLVGNSNNYGGKIGENEFAVFGSMKLILKNLILNAGIRKEFYEQLNPEPQYSFGFRYKVNHLLILRSSFSTKFRKPTFNEKYWTPGGNRYLKPEKGHGGEITIEWNPLDRKTHRFWAETNLTGYFQTVDNWIQWVIGDSLTPVEYKKVHTGGLEAWIEYGFTMAKLTWTGQVNYNFNHAVIVSTFDKNPQYEGNQLIYTPKHVLRTSSDITYGSFLLGVTALYTGKRETVETADPMLRLPAFFLFDINMGFRKNFRDMPLALCFRVDNLFDKSFEIIRSYPLPGRTYQFTLTIGLNKTSPKI
jgi:outer membrane cobalamin receptor